jgi:hypothetical protein
VLLIALFRRLRAFPDPVKWAPLAALCALVVILVDSLGGPTLFGWVPTIGFAMVFGPVMVASFPDEGANGRSSRGVAG